MNQPFPVRAVAGCLALAAFAIAIISGLAAGRSTDSILVSALVAMLVGQVVGYASGLAISRALLENLGRHTNSGGRETPSPGARDVPGATGASVS